MSRLLAVSVGQPRDVAWRGAGVRTGVFKRPAEGRVSLRATGLEGDGQADLAAHGGPHKAVCAYAGEHYPFWRGELGRDDLHPGQFGENLTVAGWTEDAVCVGDVFRVGTALLEVSQPRTPCSKLGLRMEDAAFPKRFLASGRTGFYLRVLEEGDVGAGDAAERVGGAPDRVTVRELSRLLHFERGDRGRIERALAVAALAPAWREPLADLLAQAGG